MLNKIQSGDIVKHVGFDDAIGIVIQRVQLSFETAGFVYWDVFWIKHPTEQGTITILSSKWFKHFSGYRKCRKQVDKTNGY